MAHDDEKDQGFGKAAISWLGIGIEFVIVICIGCGIGALLDQIQDTFPGFMIIGFLVAFAIMLYNMLKRAGSFKSKTDRESE